MMGRGSRPDRLEHPLEEKIWEEWGTEKDGWRKRREQFPRRARRRGVKGHLGRRASRIHIPEVTENEMVGLHHRLNGHEFERVLGVGDGLGSLACCSPWGHKESDMTEQLN